MLLAWAAGRKPFQPVRTLTLLRCKIYSDGACLFKKQSKYLRARELPDSIT
jgi:hypothetical protein